MKHVVAIALCLVCLLQACARVEGHDSGQQRVVDPSTGQVLLEAERVDGRLHGEFRTWYPNGEPREEGRWEQGLPVSVRTRWHATGHMAEQGAFVDGLREGPWPSWYEDGQCEWTGVWQGGARHGTWMHYARGGAVLAEEQWEHGTRLSVVHPAVP